MKTMFFVLLCLIALFVIGSSAPACEYGVGCAVQVQQAVYSQPVLVQQAVYAAPALVQAPAYVQRQQFVQQQVYAAPAFAIQRQAVYGQSFAVQRSFAVQQQVGYGVGVSAAVVRSPGFVQQTTVQRRGLFGGGLLGRNVIRSRTVIR